MHSVGRGLSRRSARIAAVVLVCATPGVAFWLVGDLSLPGDQHDLDYFWRPYLSSRWEWAIGLTSTAAFVAAAAYLARSRRDVPPGTSAKWVVGLLMLAGAILAFGYRVTTAGVIGANIGAGLFILFGLPPCLVLVVSAAVISGRVSRSAAGSSN